MFAMTTQVESDLNCPFYLLSLSSVRDAPFFGIVFKKEEGKGKQQNASIIGAN